MTIPAYSRARSIKTRIETEPCILLYGPLFHSRARSIKTRIETFLDQEYYFEVCNIREQDPLKQGLKLDVFSPNCLSSLAIREQDPLKQGLKHRYLSIHFIEQKDSRARSIKTRIETRRYRQ